MFSYNKHSFERYYYQQRRRTDIIYSFLSIIFKALCSLIFLRNSFSFTFWSFNQPNRGIQLHITLLF